MKQEINQIMNTELVQRLEWWERMEKWEIENPVPDKSDEPDNELKLKIWEKERIRYAKGKLDS